MPNEANGSDSSNSNIVVSESLLLNLLVLGCELNGWTREDIVKGLSWECRSIPEVVDSVVDNFSVDISLHLDGLNGVVDVVVPGSVHIIDEDLLVSLKHLNGLIVLVESKLHKLLDLLWVNGQIKVEFNIW